MKEVSNKSGYLHDAARTLYFVALGAFTISLLLNQPEYFHNKRWELIILDAISVFLIYLSLLLYLKKVITLKLTSAVFIYCTVINLSFSIWYHYYHDFHFTGNFLLNTFIYSIYLLLAGFCIGRKHIYFVAGIYLVSYIPLIFISKDIFLINIVYVLPFLVLAYSLAISAILYLLDKSHKKELKLRETILEKEHALVQEQNKWLNCQLEAKQREITANSMFLLEHVKNNNAFIKKLNVLKQCLNTEEHNLLNNIIQEHKTDHLQKYLKEFEASFMETQPEFYKKLHHICPNLSPSERKLAAFLHLGLSSKQIGSIISISTESVEVARSRLRNKLNLQAESNLGTFLSNL